MQLEDNNYFIQYLKDKDIKVIDGFNGKLSDDKDVTEAEALNQIYIISEFHKKAMGYIGSIGSTLENNTGRLVENCKVEVKRLKRDISNIKIKGPKNDFEKLLITEGESYVNRAEQCIEHVYSWNYIDLIYRSMRRDEICLGDVGPINLRKKTYIEINTLEKCCNNMVECDAIEFFNKLKRKDSKINFEKLINAFCEREELDNSSKEFIKAMISYPYDFIKCCIRYRENKKNWTLEEYESRLIKSMKKDGYSML
ncbi:hypothetical protein [Desnuesiella massiliensis]|uniref:hypothetical protein n=1 Tax=Desnuesiella massiliensis TaxID=1650662 RepID=UPI0006E438C6|nr:hypothetical protein [Desnuesiella massiliensis]